MGKTLTPEQQEAYARCFRDTVAHVAGQHADCGMRALCERYSALPKLKKSQFWDYFHGLFERACPGQASRTKLQKAYAQYYSQCLYSRVGHDARRAVLQQAVRRVAAHDDPEHAKAEIHAAIREYEAAHGVQFHTVPRNNLAQAVARDIANIQRSRAPARASEQAQAPRQAGIDDADLLQRIKILLTCQ